MGGEGGYKRKSRGCMSGEWRERKWIAGREEGREERNSMTGRVVTSINYNMATRASLWNSMQTHNMRKEEKDVIVLAEWLHENTKTGWRNDGGRFKNPQRPLNHDLSRQHGGFPATLCLNTCLSACQHRVSHGWCSIGACSMLTHSNTEAFEKVWDGRYVPRDQCGSAALQS